MKKYEGLFILNTAGKEEGIKEIIDSISSEITNAGGKIETVQRMDKRQFSRVADKRFSSGFFVNIIFESEPSVVAQLKTRLIANNDVFRVMITLAAEPKVAAAA